MHSPGGGVHTGVAAFLAGMDLPTEEYLELARKRHVRFPKLRILDVEAKQTEIRILFALREPGLDLRRPRAAP